MADRKIILDTYKKGPEVVISLFEKTFSKNLFRIYDIICTKRIFSMIHNYTSNVSREQFEFIREDLENARKRTRPRTVGSFQSWLKF